MQNEDQPRRYPTYQWVIGALLVIPALLMLVTLISPDARRILKPWIIWVSSAVVLVIIGLASSFSSGESGQSGNQASDQPTQETPPVAVAAPVATPTPTCPDAQERAYFLMMASIVNEMTRNADGLANQTMQFENNPLVTKLDEWTYKTAAYVVGLQQYVEAVRELSPPNSARRVHDPYLRAVDAMEEALNHYLRAVDNMDGTALEQSTTAFLEHNRFLEEANTAIRNFCQTTPPVAVDTTSTCPDAQERAYFSTMASIFNEKMLPNTDGLSNQTAQFANNPLVTKQDKWTYTTAAYVVGLQMYVEAVRELSPPNSARRVHDPLLRAVDSMEEALNHFLSGVDNLDPTAIERSTTAMLEHNRFIGEVNAAMGTFCK